MYIVFTIAGYAVLDEHLAGKDRTMSNEALYGLILLVAAVLAIGGGIALVNWVFIKAKARHHQ
ncbi:MAG: hypothetical protein B7X82_14535 [Hydrogenophilales bacterium 17-64-65]|nr:MAG: hypothetical protein B7X82_14535 [Hydrogenophilales bacterium 17-64-65]